MSYTKTTWSDGDVITAEKLNNIESGIESAGIFIVNANEGVLNKTWQEIYNALNNNIPAYLIIKDNISDVGFYLITHVYFNDRMLTYYVDSEFSVYTTDSASDYPSSAGDR